MDRVREFCWKVPKVTSGHIAEKHGSIGIKNAHARIFIIYSSGFDRSRLKEVPSEHDAV